MIPPFPLPCAPGRRSNSSVNKENKGPSAFPLDYQIMMDTGCPEDLIAKHLALRFPIWIHKALPKTFDTANNAYSSSDVVTAHFSPFHDEPCEFYCMGSSPTVMSVGSRCEHKGFSFIWLPGMVPVMITPLLKIVPLDVVNSVPYVKEQGLHSYLTDPKQIRERTGVYVTSK